MVDVAIIPESVSGDYRAGMLSWRTALRAEGKSPATIRAYLSASRFLAEFLVSRGMPTAPQSISAEHIREFLLAQPSPSTARIRYMGLRRMFAYLLAEGELRKDPMTTVRPPKVAEDEVGRPFLSDAEFGKMLATCKRRRPPLFVDRRDAAILLVLRRSGLRRAEATDLTLDDVDTSEGLVVVRHGKGGRSRVSAFDAETAAAILRYLAVRSDHAARGETRLWLSIQGAPITSGSLAALVRRRAQLAGVRSVSPHQLRHAFANDLKSRGVSDETLMALGGWRSRTVMARYGKAQQRERAIDEYRRLTGER